MNSLTKKKCIPCSGGIPPLGRDQCLQLHRQLNARWHLHLSNDRLYCFLNTNHPEKQLELIRRIGELAEKEWHHPELQWGAGYLNIQIWTHKIDALVESDFILAAKIDQVLTDSNIPDLDQKKPGLNPHWNIESNRPINRLKFKDFRVPFEKALKIASLKEGDYYPRIHLGFGHLEIEIGKETDCLTTQEILLTDKIDKVLYS